MKYKFVKIQDHFYENHIYDWMLECTDIDTLAEHTKKYMGTVIEDAIKEIFDSSNDSNIESKYAKAILQTREATGQGIIPISMNFEQEIINSKLKNLNKYGKIYLRENGSYTLSTDTHEILNSIKKDDILFPNYTEKDIRIVGYNGGRHYYAKIGNFDVVDDNGDQKWNTAERAEEIAKKYLETI